MTALAKVKKDLAAGGSLEVECSESAYRSGSQMSGAWLFYLVSPTVDGNQFRSQVLVSRTIEPKRILTVTGLVSLAMDLQIRAPVFPLHAGDKGVWKIGK